MNAILSPKAGAVLVSLHEKGFFFVFLCSSCLFEGGVATLEKVMSLYGFLNQPKFSMFNNETTQKQYSHKAEWLNLSGKLLVIISKNIICNFDFCLSRHKYLYNTDK